MVDPGSGRFPREGNGYSLQYLCLENPMDTRGASWVTVHRIAKNQAWLSDCVREKQNTYLTFSTRLGGEDQRTVKSYSGHPSRYKTYRNIDSQEIALTKVQKRHTKVWFTVLYFVKPTPPGPDIPYFGPALPKKIKIVELSYPTIKERKNVIIMIFEFW